MRLTPSCSAASADGRQSAEWKSGPRSQVEAGRRAGQRALSVYIGRNIFSGDGTS